ncbi:MAG: DNA polymerase III subunit beta [Tepidanaerobacteraceae bacterium]
MKFIIDLNELILSISTVEKFVPSKSPISILSGIKFFASNNCMYISATDFDMGIEYKIKADSEILKISEDGAFVLGAKILSEIVRKIPKGMVEFTRQDNKVNISSGEFNMVLPCFDADDFPEISKKDSFYSIKLEQQLFKDMIKKTIFARSDDTTSRPQLTGLLIDIKDNILNIVALDGFRIAWRYEELKAAETDELKDIKTIIPGNTLMEITRIFSDEEDEYFDFYIGNNRVEFATDKILISSRVLDGNFIDYKKAIDVETKTSVQISTEALHSAVDRANILAREGNRNNLIKFRISEDIIQVEAQTELGSISDKVSCKLEGEDLVIAFNARFFIEALRTISAPSIKLDFSGDMGPCIIRPSEIENHINFILPVKLRGDDF